MITDLYYPVEKVLVDDIMPGYEHPSGLTHAVIVTKPDGVKRIVNYCSDIYHLVPNERVVQPFIDTMKSFFEIDVKFQIMANYAVSFIDIIFKKNPLLMAPGDTIFPRIRMVNSYDGTRKYQFIAGLWRQVCTNGLGLPHGSQREFKGMHTPKLGNETNFEGVLALASEFLASSNDIFELFQELNEQKIRMPKFRVEEVIESTSFPNTIEQDVTDRLAIEMGSNTVANDWLIYNAFNYQLNHNEDIKTKEKKREEIDREVLDYLLKY